jgi:hypothetical protein
LPEPGGPHNTINFLLGEDEDEDEDEDDEDDLRNNASNIVSSYSNVPNGGFVSFNNFNNFLSAIILLSLSSIILYYKLKYLKITYYNNM